MNTLLMGAIEWDIDPTIFQIGNYELRYYTLFFMLSFGIGYKLVERVFKQEGEDIEKLGTLLTFIAIGGIMGARIGHCLFYDWDYFSTRPLEILLPIEIDNGIRFTGFRGLASHGGAIGLIISLILWSKKHAKKHVFWIMDRLVVPMCIAGGFIRFGNLMNSEIVGSKTDVSWGFEFLQSYPGEIRHAVQLYESLAYFTLAAVLFYLFENTKLRDRRGYFFGLFLSTLFSIRLILEFFKKEQTGLQESIDIGLTTGQLLSIPFILAGLFIMYKSKEKND
jgi:phosphatidylglycerol:prolipoprotein diacylglycerol transferase